jgi:hypothetical protein
MQLKPQYRKKLIYVTPGAGKTSISKEHIDIVDSDDLMEEEILKLHPDFIREPKESIQNYILRFVETFKYKTKINNRVRKKARRLNDDGMTVLTGTVKLAKYADFVFIIHPSNPRLEDRFGTLENAMEKHELEVRQIRQFKVPYLILKGDIEDEILMRTREKS